MIAPWSEHIPVTILTGFLGAGKTTILRQLLEGDSLRTVLVVINEFGEIGLDHDLVAHAADDMAVELTTGCLCCSSSGDLGRVLREAPSRYSRNGVPWFSRVVVETTGIADPVPILHLLMTDPGLCEKYHIDGVVTAVDAVNGVSTLERHPEAVRQVAVADRVLVTKTDVSSLSQIAELEQRVRLHNGHAHLHRVAPGRVDASWITHNGLYDVATKSADVNRWLLHELHRTTPSRTIGALAPPPSSGILAGVDFGPALQAAKILSTPWSQSLRGETLEPRHGEVRTASLVITDPINPASFEEWLTLLVGLRGEDFLRTKGILNVQGVSGPVVIHGVQDVFHPPVTLDAWPSDDHRSRLVFITRGISVERLQETLSLFLAASKAPVAA